MRRLTVLALFVRFCAELGLSIYEDEPSEAAPSEAEADMPPLEDESATVMVRTHSQRRPATHPASRAQQPNSPFALSLLFASVS